MAAAEATGALLHDAEHLIGLEERILKVVNLVSELREEKAILESDLNASIAAHKSTEERLRAAEEENMRLNGEIERLQNEHREVKARISKVLGQLDLLGSNT